MSNRQATEKALDAAVETFTKSDLQDRKTAQIMNGMLGVSTDEHGNHGTNRSEESSLFVNPRPSKTTKQATQYAKPAELVTADPVDDIFAVNDDEFVAALSHFEKTKARSSSVQVGEAYDGIVDTDETYATHAPTQNPSTSVEIGGDVEAKETSQSDSTKNHTYQAEQDELARIQKEKDLFTERAKVAAEKEAAKKAEEAQESNTSPYDELIDDNEPKTRRVTKPKSSGSGFTSSLFSFASQFVEALEETITFIATGKEPEMRPSTNRLRRRREESVIGLLSNVFALADEDKDGKISKEQAWDLFVLVILHAKLRAKRCGQCWDDDEWDNTKVDYADVLAYYPKSSLNHTAWCDFICEVDLDDEILVDVLTTIAASPLPKTTTADPDNE